MATTAVILFINLENDDDHLGLYNLIEKEDVRIPAVVLNVKIKNQL